MNPSHSDIAEEIVSIRPHRSMEGMLLVRVGPARSSSTARRARNAVVLSPKGIERLGLRVGLAWTEDRSHAAANEVMYEKARSGAVRWISKRALTRHAVVKRLSRFQLATADVARLVEELLSMGLIDDAGLAARYADASVRREPTTREALTNTLVRHGISESDATTAAREALKEHDPVMDAKAVASKRLRAMPAGLPPQASKRRLFAYLARRGFDEDTATTAVEHAMRGWSRNAESE